MSDVNRCALRSLDVPAGSMEHETMAHSIRFQAIIYDTETRCLVYLANIVFESRVLDPMKFEFEMMDFMLRANLECMMQESAESVVFLGVSINHALVSADNIGGDAP